MQSDQDKENLDALHDVLFIGEGHSGIDNPIIYRN